MAEIDHEREMKKKTLKTKAEEAVKRGIHEARRDVVNGIHADERHVEDGAKAVVHAVEHPVETIIDTGEHIKDSSIDFKDRVEDNVSDTVKYVDSQIHSPIDKKKLPLAMKILGALCMLGGALTLIPIGMAIYSAVTLLLRGQDHDVGTVTIVVQFVLLAILVASAIVFAVFGVSLLRNRRRFAAMAVIALALLILGGIICDLMLHGISWNLVFFGIVLVILIALSSYLDPSLVQERRLHRKLRDLEVKEEADEGTLGRDQTGKGYITLNFFNLFWIFVVSSILGLIIETVFHYAVFGDYQDRAGLLYGPFSPIYGFGAVLMTIFLNRFHKANFIIIFLISAVIGGAFEYFTSWFMQYTYGAVAWNYTGMWLSIGGRTCGLFMAMWGLLGLIWIKLLLPLLLKIINLIPWNWRYAVTTVCAILMVVDGVMTLQALDCWYERLSHDPVDTPVQEFYAEHFDNQFMQNRFQSMTIHPDDAIRSHD